MFKRLFSGNHITQECCPQFYKKPAEKFCRISTHQKYISTFLFGILILHVWQISSRFCNINGCPKGHTCVHDKCEKNVKRYFKESCDQSNEKCVSEFICDKTKRKCLKKSGENCQQDEDCGNASLNRVICKCKTSVFTPWKCQGSTKKVCQPI